MKRSFVLLLALLWYAPCVLAGDAPKWDGFWWASMTRDFKLGWVSGYAKAMDFAGALRLATCVENLPLYSKAFPNTPPKQIMKTMCLDNKDADYDGITME